MSARLTHLRLLVDDFDACHRFYREVMSLKPRFGEAGGPYEEFEAGEVVLALFSRALMARVVGTQDRPARAATQDGLVLCFSVPDVDAAHADLRARGAQVVSPPHDQEAWGIRVAHFRDPDGNLVELNQPLE